MSKAAAINTTSPSPRPGDPPYRRLLAVPTASWVQLSGDIDGWWSIRDGSWSDVKTGTTTTTAAGGPVWTSFRRVDNTNR